MINNSNEFAGIIVQQLGGIGKLQAMIGAKNFTYNTSNKSITFKFMQGNKKINCITIALNSNDLYNLTFYSIKKIDFTIITTINDVFNSDLKNIFESTTGLYLSL